MQSTDGPSSTGLHTNLAATLSYAFFFVTGILFLLVEKRSRFVRFHAWQSTLFFLALWVVWIVLRMLGLFGTMVITFILMPVSLAIWLVLLFKAFQGEKFKLPYFGDLAESKV